MQRDREEWTVDEYLRAVGRGDATAHRRLDLCAKRLAAAKARALRLSPEDAEDAAQQVCLIAFANDSSALSRVGRASTMLSSWVVGVLDHILIDLARARASTEPAAPSDRVVQRGAERMRVAAERTARLKPAGWARLSELTPPRLHALRLHLQGLSISEIATRLGCSRGAARERIRSAWAQLRAKARSSVRVQAAALLADGRTRLDTAEREILVALMKGQSYRQIAAARSETAAAIRSRIRRALGRLTHRQPEGETTSLPPVNRLHG